MPATSEKLAELMAAEGFISVPEAADRLGVHATTVRIWIHRGDLPHRKRGSRWFVNEKAIERMAKE